MNNKAKLHTMIVAGLLSLSACSNSTTTSSSTSDSTTSMTTKVDTAMSHAEQGAKNVVNDVKDAVNGNADSNFVVKAAVDNAMDLKVLQAGWDKGTDKELKNHAKMMIADHKKLGAAVKAYADKKSYVLPVDDNGKADDALSSIDKNNAGKDWDKAWTDKVTDAHKDAISMFEKGQSDVKDPELKNIIAGALPTFRSHLNMMQQLQDKMGK